MLVKPGGFRSLSDEEYVKLVLVVRKNMPWSSQNKA